MNYQEAFEQLINQFGLSVLNDNLLVRSFLSDLVGNSYQDSQLIDAFYSLNKSYSIYLLINHMALNEAKSQIKQLIVNSNRKYSVEQYIRSTEPLLFTLYPGEYVSYQGLPTANKPVEVKRVNRVVQKVAPPAIKPTPVPKPKPKPKKKKNVSLIDSISITANCKSLLVTYGSNKEIKVLRNGYDFTSYIKSFIRVNANFIEIDDYKGIYTVELPKQPYKKLKVIYVGKKLEVSSKSARRMIVDEVSISGYLGESYVSTNSKTVYFLQRKGIATFRGKMNDLHMRKDKCLADITMHNGAFDDLELSMVKNTIDLTFLSHKLSHNPYNGYSKLKKVNWTYKLGHEQVKLNMSSKRGKIIIK